MNNDMDSANNNLVPSQSELVNLLNYFQNNQFDLALKTATDLSEKFPNHPFAWTVLGAVYNQIGKLNEGLIACEKAVKLEPKNAEANNNLGNTFFKLGRLDQAEASCRKAIQLDSKNALAQNNLGNILFKLKKLEEAETAYRIAISIQQNNVQALYLKRRAFLIEATYSTELHSVVIPVPVHPDTNCSSDYVLFWNKPPKARITTVGSIIAHNKVMPFWYRTFWYAF